jgi:hypothetical protein
MSDHLKVLSVLGFVRAALGVILGVYLLWKAANLGFADYEGAPLTAEIEWLDRTAFRVLGIACLTLAPIRALQAALVRRGHPLGRVMGIWLALFDMVNLVLFPISTALGIYGYVVYRSYSAVMFFERRHPRVQPGR